MGASAVDLPPTTDADRFKDEGNVFFKAGDYLKAAAAYTKGLKADEKNAVLFSNRSAALLQLSKVTKALADADQAIELRPTWDKGHFRRACALEATKRLDDALASYKQALALNPGSADVAAKVKSLAAEIRNAKKAQSFSFPAAAETADARPATAKSAAKTTAEREKRIVAFSQDILKSVCEECVKSAGGGPAPMVRFLLPGASGPAADSEGGVKIDQAFDSPDTHAEVTAFLRKFGADRGALAAVAVVPRERIAYPQLWLPKPGGGNDNGWPCGDKKGFFLQLEAPGYRRLWFLPKGSLSTSFVPEPVVVLDAASFAILPALF